MDPKISLAFYLYNFVALGYVVIAWSYEKFKMKRTQKH